MFGISDDYSAYMEGKDMRLGGKLFLVDESDYNTVEVFFDEGFDKYAPLT